MASGSFGLQPSVSSLLLLLAFLLIVYLAAPFLAQRMLFMPPGVDPGEPPELPSGSGSEVFLEADDGVRLHAWWYRANRTGVAAEETVAAPAVVLLHGNAGSIVGRTTLANGYVERGVSVLLLSYRGYGRSEGRPTLSGTPLDARAALDFVAGEVGGMERVVVHGRSMGGAVGLSALTLEGPAPAGFILESTFTSLEGMGRSAFPFFPAPLLRRLRGPLNSLTALRGYEGPVLVIHGGRDDVVPPEMSRMLHDVARDPEELWIVERAGHNDLEFVAGTEYLDRVARFVLRVTSDGDANP